jgi:hypothetical protein
MPQIAVINESTAISDADVQNMLSAFNQQWNQDLLPVWGVDAATFTFVPQGQAPASGTWWVVFLDDSDQAGALAYHDLTDEGLPISKVFVKTIQGDNASVSVGATHEICEMAVDPWLNSAYQDPQGVFWAGEICDPVEDDRPIRLRDWWRPRNRLHYAELVRAPERAEQHRPQGACQRPVRGPEWRLCSKVRSTSWMAAGHRIYGEAQQTGQCTRGIEERTAGSPMDKSAPCRRPCRRA